MTSKTTKKLLKIGKKSTNLLTNQTVEESVFDVSTYYNRFFDLYQKDSNAFVDYPDFCGGFDGGTEISFYGVWFKGEEQSEFLWGALTTRLDALKQTAQNKENECITFPIGDEKWQVMPGGTGSGVKYKWLIKRGGASIGIHSNPKKNIAPIHVKLEYEALYGEKFDNVMAKIETVLTKLGFTIDRDVVSRVDLQVTIAGVSMREVCRALTENRFVSRIRKPKIDGWVSPSEFETATWGDRKNRKAQVCIYNKFREAFKDVSCSSLGQKAVDLLNIFGPKVGGFFGQDICYSECRDDMLVRVEFRLFRDFLRLHNIDSYYDLLDDMPNLIKYLTEEYFKVVETSRNDNTHYYESEFSDWWKLVIHAFNEVFVAGRSFVTKRDRRISVVAIEDLIKQFAGCVTSALAQVPYVGKDGVDEQMPYSVFFKMLLAIMEDRSKDMYKDYERKRKQFRGNIEPLDMTSVDDSISRKMSAREQRKERLAKDKHLRTVMLEKNHAVRSEVSDRDYDGCEEVPNRVDEWISVSEYNKRYGRA